MPVTTTLQANALTNLAAVLDELDLVSDGGAVDSRLNRFINSASDFIERECGRTFRRADAIVETTPGYGLPWIKLKRTPILTLTSITFLGNAYDVANLDVVDDGAGVVLRRVGFPWTAFGNNGISQRPVPGSEFRDLTVTYNAGYVTPKQVDDTTFTPRTLPGDLEDACVQLAASRFRGRGTDIRLRSEGGQAQSRTFGGEPIPPEVDAIISHYARIPNA